MRSARVKRSASDLHSPFKTPRNAEKAAKKEQEEESTGTGGSELYSTTLSNEGKDLQHHQINDSSPAKSNGDDKGSDEAIPTALDPIGFSGSGSPSATTTTSSGNSTGDVLPSGTNTVPVKKVSISAILLAHREQLDFHSEQLDAINSTLIELKTSCIAECNDSRAYSRKETEKIDTKLIDLESYVKGRIDGMLSRCYWLYSYCRRNGMVPPTHFFKDAPDRDNDGNYRDNPQKR